MPSEIEVDHDFDLLFHFLVFGMRFADVSASKRASKRARKMIMHVCLFSDMYLYPYLARSRLSPLGGGWFLLVAGAMAYIQYGHGMPD